MAKKKKKPKYNQSSAIISALKRTFSRSPVVTEVKNLVRTEHDQFKKDGTLAKKKAVRFKCAECKKIHMGKDIQVDHLEVVVPLNIPAKYICMDTLINRLFVTAAELQVLCKPCHKEKSKKENAIRREWKAKTKEKHIVYKTTNRLNNKFYVGIHSTFDYDDGYIGSGNAFIKAVKKYGKDQFYYRILSIYDTREEAIAKETEIVDEAFVKDRNTYNLVSGGIGRVYTSEETRRKISENRDYSGITGKNSPASVEVVCVETGEVFGAIAEAAKFINHKGGSKISKSCEDVKCSAGGYHWQYYDNFDPNVVYDPPKNNSGQPVVNCRGKTFNTINEAARFYNITKKSNIGQCCLGNRSSAGKYLDGTSIKWRFNKLDK